jgi:hypothetical protein
LGGPEEAIFRGFFRYAERLANGAQPEALIMTELEDEAFAGRQLVQNTLDSRTYFRAEQLTLGINVGARFR